MGLEGGQRQGEKLRAWDACKVCSSCRRHPTCNHKSCRAVLSPTCSMHPPSSGPCSDAPPVTELFAPSYSLALAPDPLLAVGSTAGPGPAPQQAQQQRQQQQDVFLAVGLDSGISDFKRPRLNLAILLDVSGSMDGGQTC